MQPAAGRQHKFDAEVKYSVTLNTRTVSFEAENILLN